jgi:hypothetical protein
MQIVPLALNAFNAPRSFHKATPLSNTAFIYCFLTGRL